MRSGSHCISRISCPRPCVDCEHILVHPARRPTGLRNRWALGELPVKPATQTNAIEQPSPQIYWLSTAELKIGVPQQALASCNQMEREGWSPTGCDTLASYRRARSARD